MREGERERDGGQKVEVRKKKKKKEKKKEWKDNQNAKTNMLRKPMRKVRHSQHLLCQGTRLEARHHKVNYLGRVFPVVEGPGCLCEH